MARDDADGVTRRRQAHGTSVRDPARAQEVPERGQMIAFYVAECDFDVMPGVCVCVSLMVKNRT